MLILIYFAEAVMRLFNAYPAEKICATLAAALSISFFTASLSFVKQHKKTNHVR